VKTGDHAFACGVEYKHAALLCRHSIETFQDAALMITLVSIHQQLVSPRPAGNPRLGRGLIYSGTYRTRNMSHVEATVRI
jgi:hypothetical protein